MTALEESSGYAIPPSESRQLGAEELEIAVVGVSGDGFKVRVPKSLTASELRNIIRDRLPLKAGARVVVMKGSQKLSLSKTLAQEGLVQEKPTSLSYAYEVTNLQEAWRCFQERPVDDESIALEGILQLRGLRKLAQLKNLVTLKDLAFGDEFNQSLQGVVWPSGLQSLSFGSQFNQSLEGVAWPSGLQSLSFGYEFNQSMEGVAWPSGLQSLSFGYEFNQSMEGVAWPSNLHRISCWSWALKRANWPSSFLCLEVTGPRSEAVEMDIPEGLQKFAYTVYEDEDVEDTWMISTLDISTL
ncbi:unnamed protein product [Durusdinium trenchii]|uniref:Ubiquitin-like domain-containing protein n=1 Tax=Durusdinium trenchii TaxID=1381693 RepID=A0ABP0RQP4_9DINO